jgi:hypothetical protein
LLARDSRPLWEKISWTGSTRSVGSCPADVSANEITGEGYGRPRV